MIRFWCDPVARPGWQQMAIDRGLLDLADRHGLALARLYTWSDDTISFGAHEATARHWDRDRIQAAPLATVRRPSGGRAVWHGTTDLTYAVALPSHGIPAARTTYRTLHLLLRDALDRLTLAPTLAPTPSRSPGLGAGSCFDQAAGGEVLLDGRKTIGSAQLVLQQALLQHGQIARSVRTPVLAHFARGAGETPRPAAPADDLPPAPLLAAAIADTWRAAGWEEVGPDAAEPWLAAAAPWEAQFRDPAWTWRR